MRRIVRHLSCSRGNSSGRFCARRFNTSNTSPPSSSASAPAAAPAQETPEGGAAACDTTSPFHPTASAASSSSAPKCLPPNETLASQSPELAVDELFLLSNDFTSGDEWTQKVRSARAEAVSDVFRLHTISGLEWIDVQGALKTKTTLNLARIGGVKAATTAGSAAKTPGAKGESTLAYKASVAQAARDSIDKTKARLFRPHTDLAFMACIAPLLVADGVHEVLIKDAVRRVILPQAKVLLNETQTEGHGKPRGNTSSSKAADPGTTKACLLMCRFPMSDHSMLPTAVRRGHSEVSSTTSYTKSSVLSPYRDTVFEELLFGQADQEADGPTTAGGGGERRAPSIFRRLFDTPAMRANRLRAEVTKSTTSAGVGDDSVLKITTRLTMFLLPESNRLITCHRAPITIISKMRSGWCTEGFNKTTSLLELVNVIMKGCMEAFVSSAAQHTLWLDQFESSLFAKTPNHFDDTSHHPNSSWRSALTPTFWRSFQSAAAVRRRTTGHNKVVESIYCINRRASVFCRLLQPLPYAYAQVVAATTNNRSLALLDSLSGGPIATPVAPRPPRASSSAKTKQQYIEAGLALRKAETERFLAQDVGHHGRNALTMCEDLRDSSQALLSLHFQLTSNELEELVRVITLVSTVFIPLTFIGSIFGMTFETWEAFYEDDRSIWISVVLMAGAMFCTWFWVWWRFVV